MDRQDNFEKKIKDKLESIESPYEDAAWESFAPLLAAPKIPFWKQWFMPYLYSTGLFFVSLFLWYQKDTLSVDPSDRGYFEQGVQVDTIFRKDTVYVIDTIYLYKKIYVGEEIGLTSSNGQTQTPRLEKLYQEASNSTPFQSSDPKVKNVENGQKSDSSSIQTSGIKSTKSDPGVAKGGLYHEKQNLPAGGVGQEVQKEPFGLVGSGDRTIAAPSIVQDPGFVMKLEKELVEGDTSNLNRKPPMKSNKPFFNMEAAMSLIIPVNRLIEYSPSFSQGVNFGLEWENGWGVYVGAWRNRMTGEIDDDDIRNFRPSLLSTLPNIPGDINTIDEIYQTNRQWFFPMELRWRSLYYNGFSFESSAGLMGNYLHQQQFRYEFEDQLGLADLSASSDLRSFKVSHLRIGVGTNLLLSGRFGMFLRSHYWLPISGAGLLEYRMHGMEIGFGVNYFVGK